MALVKPSKYSFKRMGWRGCFLVAKLVRLGYSAIINVDAKDVITTMVRGPTGHMY